MEEVDEQKGGWEEGGEKIKLPCEGNVDELGSSRDHVWVVSDHESKCDNSCCIDAIMAQRDEEMNDE